LSLERQNKLASRFSLLASRFSLLASRFSLLASRFPTTKKANTQVSAFDFLSLIIF